MEDQNEIRNEASEAELPYRMEFSGCGCGVGCFVWGFGDEGEWVVVEMGDGVWMGPHFLHNFRAAGGGSVRWIDGWCLDMEMEMDKG